MIRFIRDLLAATPAARRRHIERMRIAANRDRMRIAARR